MKQLINISILFSVLFITGLKAQNNSTVKSDMIYVEGGTFKMGSNDGRENEKPVHSVTVSSFYMCIHEVTVAEYKAFCRETSHQMPEEPVWGWNDQHPIVNVSWSDAVAYCDWLSNKKGKTYRLPTEAEWEYAARGGNKSHGYKFAGSNDIDEVGWYNENSKSQNTNSVMKKKPNELGLYDMSGNAWEWCNDKYDEEYYNNSPSIDPVGPDDDDYHYHVLRGGSFCNWRISNPSSSWRITFRFCDYGDIDKDNEVGFRVVLQVKKQNTHPIKKQKKISKQIKR